MPKKVNRTITMNTLEKKHLGEAVRLGRNEAEGDLMSNGEYLMVAEVYIGEDLHHYGKHHPLRVGSIIHLMVDDPRNKIYANIIANPVTWRAYRIAA